jgi:hypothetical protein
MGCLQCLLETLELEQELEPVLVQGLQQLERLLILPEQHLLQGSNA